MPISNYNINFKNLVSDLLGRLKRKPIRIAWLTAGLKPVEDIHEELVDYVDAKRDEMKWTGETIVLENLLITKFGAGIYIINNIIELNGAFIGEGSDNSFFIGEGSDNSQFVDVTYEIGSKSFIVFVPNSIVFDVWEMEAYIRKYKLYGTTYEIIILP